MKDELTLLRGKTPSLHDRTMRFVKSIDLVSRGPMIWRPFSGSPLKGTEMPPISCCNRRTYVIGRMARACDFRRLTER